jgi:hypothetical protein
MNDLFIDPTKMYCISFQTNQCRQDGKLNIFIKNGEIENVTSINFWWVVIDSTLSWVAHIERSCGRISCNLFIINRLAQPKE